VTVCTGTCATVTVAVPVFPSTVAVSVAVPVPTAVTTPCALIVATVGDPLLHVTDRPVSDSPALSFALADSWTVCPM
jgi:hypothetical protein